MHCRLRGSIYIALSILLVLILPACAPVATHQPYPYPISHDQIEDFDQIVNVRVSNGYASAEPLKLGPTNAFGGGAYNGDLMAITQLYMRQLTNAMGENSASIGDATDRSITATITDAIFRNRFGVYRASIDVRLELGNGELIEFEKVKVAPKNRDHTMNGVIAEAAIETLNHPKIREYLEP